ncbi:MAG: thioredoxin family protein [Polyangiaceae bacterium]
MVYPTDADVARLTQQAVMQAQREHKRILVFLGGNWCKWCLALDAALHDDPDLASLLAKFVVLKLDADAGSDLNDEWGNPTRTGVPVMVVLTSEGRLVHAQGLVELELWGGRLLGYDERKLYAAIAAQLP